MDPKCLNCDDEGFTCAACRADLEADDTRRYGCDGPAAPGEGAVVAPARPMDEHELVDEERRPAAPAGFRFSSFGVEVQHLLPTAAQRAPGTHSDRWAARWLVHVDEPEITREELLELLLRTCYSVWLADKTEYEHHQRRARDRARPSDVGTTRWLEPKELAFAVLKRFGVNAHDVYIGRVSVPWAAPCYARRDA